MVRGITTLIVNADARKSEKAEMLNQLAGSIEDKEEKERVINTIKALQ